MKLSKKRRPAIAKFDPYQTALQQSMKSDRQEVLEKTATGPIFTLMGVPYIFDPVRGVLCKAGRRRAPSPGQLGLFGGHNEGDTKVEDGVTYRLNANSRWERMDKPKASGKRKPKPEIVPVVEAEKPMAEADEDAIAHKEKGKNGLSGLKGNRGFTFSSDLSPSAQAAFIEGHYSQGVENPYLGSHEEADAWAIGKFLAEHELTQGAVKVSQRQNDHGHHWHIGETGEFQATTKNGKVVFAPDVFGGNLIGAHNQEHFEHLTALEEKLSREQQRLREAQAKKESATTKGQVARSDDEIQFRERQIAIIKKEIDGQRYYLGLPPEEDVEGMSDDDLLRELGVEPTAVPAEVVAAPPTRKSDIRMLGDLIVVRHRVSEPTPLNADALNKKPALRDYLVGTGLVQKDGDEFVLPPGEDLPLPPAIAKDFPDLADKDADEALAGAEKRQEVAEAKQRKQAEREGRKQVEIQMGKRYGDFNESIVKAVEAALADGQTVYAPTMTRLYQLTPGELVLTPNRGYVDRVHPYTGEKTRIPIDQLKAIANQVADYADSPFQDPLEVVDDAPKPAKLGDRIRAIANDLRDENDEQKKIAARILGAAAQMAQNYDNLVGEVVDMVGEDLGEDIRSLNPNATQADVEMVARDGGNEPPPTRLADKMKAIANDLRNETSEQVKATARILDAAAQIAQNYDNLVDEVAEMVGEDLESGGGAIGPAIDG